MRNATCGKSHNEKTRDIQMRGLLKSFAYAISGITYQIKTQRNFKLHIVFGLVAILLAFFLKFTIIEFAVLLTVIGIVLALETINTAIEKTVDCITKEENEDAKHAKDCGAGGVLIFCSFAFIIGILLFIVKIVKMFL